MASRRGFGQVRRLPSGKYQARYRWPMGEPHNGPITYQSKMDAEAWLMREYRLIQTGEWTPPAERRQAAATIDKAKATSLDAWFEHVIRLRAARTRKPLAPTTVDLYRKDWRLRITDDLGRISIADLTPEIVESWWVSLPATPTSNARAYALLKSVMDDAVKAKKIKENPCQLVGAGKPIPAHEPEALSIPEVLDYLAAVPDRYRLCLSLMTWCVLRVGEATGLRRKDVDLDNKLLRIHQAVSRVQLDEDNRVWRYAEPKTAAGKRTVAIPELLIEPLQAHLDQMPNKSPDALVFTATNHRTPLHSSTIWEAHAKGARAINRPTLRPHDLRKTGATLAAQGGATIKELMRLLGHTTANVAMIYQVADDQRDQQRARRLNKEITRAQKKLAS